jgi:DNA-binding NarL/FixJ family response regulator
MTCLIVDDSTLFLESASDLLRREGVKIVGVANDGAEAVRLLQELRPDVTLVDVDLGDEDGFELTRLLKDTSPESKVILVSTYSEEDVAQLVRSSPAQGFIPKSRLSAQAILDLLQD